jgi:hypothetical protein
LDFYFERADVGLVLAHQAFEILDMLLVGLVYVAKTLGGFFACVACLFLASESTFPHGRDTEQVKCERRTYVQRLQESNLPLSKRGSALSPHRAVLRSTSGLEECIGSCASIHLAGLCIGELRFALAQRRAVCTVFFKKMCVFQT